MFGGTLEIIFIGMLSIRLKNSCYNGCDLSFFITPFKIGYYFTTSD